MKLLVFALVLHCVNCLGIYKCPKQRLLENFDIDKFAGRWHEVERSFYIWELYTTCLSFDVTVKKPGQVSLSVARINRLSGEQKLTEGTGTRSKKDPSIYHVRVSKTLPKVIEKFLPGAAAYQIIDTDYENYAVVWSCSSYGIFHYDRVWILGRNWDISVEIRAKIYNFLSNRGIDTDRLLISSKNC